MFDDIKQKCDRFTMGCIDLNNRLGKIERDFQGENSVVMLNVTRAIVYKQKTGNNESDQSVCRTQVG
jgi:hypothetical protein